MRIAVIAVFAMLTVAWAAFTPLALAMIGFGGSEAMKVDNFYQGGVVNLNFVILWAWFLYTLIGIAALDTFVLRTYGRK